MSYQSCLRAASLCLLAFVAVATATAQTADAAPVKVTSPNGQIVFLLNNAPMPNAAGNETALGSAGPNTLQYSSSFARRN